MDSVAEALDRVFGAVRNGEPCVVLPARRHGAVAEGLPVALVVVAEQAGGEVVAAAVPLAALGVDLDFHRAAPANSVISVRARAVITRVSNAAHSSSPTVCRSGVTSALPMASRRQKWASASGDSAGSRSPPPGPRRVRPASHAARSPTQA